MTKTVWLTHGLWAAAVAGAFFAGEILGPEAAGGSAVPTNASKSAGREAMTLTALRSPRLRPPTRASGFAVEMESILAETNGNLRRNRARRFIDQLTLGILAGISREMAPGLAQMFEEGRRYPNYLNSGRTVESWTAFVDAWARLDPEAAVGYVAGQPTVFTGYDPRMLKARATAGASAIAEWAKDDLRSAQDFVAGLEDKTPRKELTLGLMGHLAETDLDGAIAYSAELWAGRESTELGSITNPDTRGPEPFLRPVIRCLVAQLREQRGMDGVKQWLQGVEHTPRQDGSLSDKQQAVVAIAKELEGSITKPWPDEFRELLSENGREPFLTAEVLLEATSKWLKWRALASMVDLPDEVEVKRQAVGDKFEEYLRQSPEMAAKWLRDQELGPAHDEAILVYVRQATLDDVDAAMRWAEQVSDPLLRSDLIRYVQERGGR